MNERIKELLRQTDLLKIAPTGSEYVEDPDALEHFAELIIKECAELCTQQYRKVNEFSDKSPPSPNAVYIKEHFGVE